MKPVVGLFFGGVSPEYKVSLASAAAVLRHLPRARYDCRAVGITRGGRWFLTEASPDEIEGDRWQNAPCTPAALSPDPGRPGLLLFPAEGQAARLHLDVLFPVTHGTYGEDGRLQGLFALSGIPFVGCDTQASAVCMDKALTKTLLRAEGVPVLPSLLLHRADVARPAEVICRVENEIGFPAFVKPARSGSSVGAGRADNTPTLLTSLVHAAGVDDRILVEPCVRAREVEVAILETGGTLTVSHPGEIRPHAEFYDYDTKYTAGRATLCDHADISPACADTVRALAEKIFRLLELRGMARVDFFVTDDEHIYCNEINTLPGFTAGSMYPRLLSGEDGFAGLLDRLIAGARR